MAINDPIADLLTRIRNAAHAHQDSVVIPYSKTKEAVSRVLFQEGFLKGVEVMGEGKRKSIAIAMKYMPEGQPVFTNLERVSKLGRRSYVAAANIRPSRQGMGVAILSTSKGIMKDEDAKRQGVGGEVLCTVW
jgi:small subunit ribosomal protein S8